MSIMAWAFENRKRMAQRVALRRASGGPAQLAEDIENLGVHSVAGGYRERVDGSDGRGSARSATWGRATAPAPGVIRVLVADEQELFRRGLYVVLDSEDQVEVVGEAGDAASAASLAVALAPDVVLIGVRMPSGGVDAIRRIRELVPETRILVLTASDDDGDLYRAIEAGANGYLLKEISVEEVAEAVRAVVAGRSPISPSMASKLIDEFGALARRAASQEQAEPVLTVRELEVLRIVARGRTNREVATELFISENTVKNHVRNILEKLHLHSRMEAVMYAVAHRLLEPPGPDRP